MWKTVDILGVKIDRVTTRETLETIKKWLAKDEQRFIVTPNPEFILLAQKDEEFKKILNAANLAVPDGIGILWAATLIKSKVKSQKSKALKRLEIIFRALWLLSCAIFYPKKIKRIIPERVSGSDLVWKVVEIAERLGQSIFLLGAKRGVAKKASQKLRDEFPKLKIVGTESKLEGGLSQIQKTKPDIIFVALGAPRQEKWIYQNLTKFPSVKIAIGVGGSLDFIAEKLKRAPKWIRKINLEWLWRLFQEPKRIKRIYRAIIKFPNLIIQFSLR